MIPKIIHYVWLSGEPFSPETQKCLDTWKKILPDYELVLWDKERIKEIHNTFMEEAISVKKWAFATDYIRLYAVYTYGGIYLDSDVEVFQRFDSFLKDRMFIGRESWKNGIPPKLWLTSHCFGAEKGHPFLKLCMDYYQERHFIRSTNETFPNDMRYEYTIIPDIQARLAHRFYGYDWDAYRDNLQILKDGLKIYPTYYFNQPNYHKMVHVICIHHALGSWLNRGKTWEDLKSKPLPAMDICYFRHYIYYYLNWILLKFHLYLSIV
jgi:CDP-glycerol glycerophosphotransferase